MDLPTRLKELRESHNLNKTQMANKIGVTVGAYANWEYGNRMPTEEQLEQIANIFELDFEILAYGKSEINNIEYNTSDLEIIFYFNNNAVYSVKHRLRKSSFSLFNSDYSVKQTTETTNPDRSTVRKILRTVKHKKLDSFNTIYALSLQNLIIKHIIANKQNIILDDGNIEKIELPFSFDCLSVTGGFMFSSNIYELDETDLINGDLEIE